MSIQEKKEWEVPVLTVLTRTNSQEHVLCGCKHSDWGHGPTQSVNSNCEYPKQGTKDRWGRVTYCKTQDHS